MTEEACAEATRNFREPQADGGKDAWLFLAACFTIEMLLWGETPAILLSASLASIVLISSTNGYRINMDMVCQAFLSRTVCRILLRFYPITLSLMVDTGVLQHYYFTHEPFALAPSGIPAIGTSATVSDYLTLASRVGHLNAF